MESICVNIHNPTYIVLIMVSENHFGESDSILIANNTNICIVTITTQQHCVVWLLTTGRNTHDSCWNPIRRIQFVESKSPNFRIHCFRNQYFVMINLSQIKILNYIFVCMITDITNIFDSENTSLLSRTINWYDLCLIIFI